MAREPSSDSLMGKCLNVLRDGGAFCVDDVHDLVAFERCEVHTRSEVQSALYNLCNISGLVKRVETGTFQLKDREHQK